MYPEDRYDDRTHLMRGQKGSGARGTRKTVPGGRDAEEKRMRRKDEKKEKKKKKWIASWFTPSFVIVALVVLNGDSARGTEGEREGRRDGGTEGRREEGLCCTPHA